MQKGLSFCNFYFESTYFLNKSVHQSGTDIAYCSSSSPLFSIVTEEVSAGRVTSSEISINHPVRQHVLHLLQTERTTTGFSPSATNSLNSGKARNSSSDKATEVSINGNSNKFFQISSAVRLFIKVYAPART